MGSSSTPRDTPSYRLAAQTAKALSEASFLVATGGGLGSWRRAAWAPTSQAAQKTTRTPLDHLRRCPIYRGHEARYIDTTRSITAVLRLHPRRSPAANRPLETPHSRPHGRGDAPAGHDRRAPTTRDHRVRGCGRWRVEDRSDQHGSSPWRPTTNSSLVASNSPPSALNAGATAPAKKVGSATSSATTGRTARA
jgi:hypothetical protein